MKENLNFSVREILALFEMEFPELIVWAKGNPFSGFLRALQNILQRGSIAPAGLHKNSAADYTKTIRKGVEKLRVWLQMEGREAVDAASGADISFQTLQILWKALRGEQGGVTSDFLLDVYYLFKQIYAPESLQPGGDDRQLQWCRRWPSGLEPEVAAERVANRDRIQQLLVEKLSRQGKMGVRYAFEPGLSAAEKLEQVRRWWRDYRFQLNLAIRNPEELNHFLGDTLSEQMMGWLNRAREKGMPFFVTPYYLSLLSIRPDSYNDEAIRCYVLYSPELIEEFGAIRAWEKEDEVVPGEPNAAGWLLPNKHNIHRRYPDVAIFIPDSMGRACGGLCAPCQRMYNFQKGHLNFDLEALKPQEDWNERLEKLIRYYEQDSQLCDILITGGDSLMSRDKTLEGILDAIYRMAVRKKEANYKRKQGMKYAEIQRVRLGTRLPVYLPCRITDSLIDILKQFREKAEKVGIRQFFVQTHFESPLEVTDEVVQAIEKLLSAGWIVTNQLVFTVAASRRGHTARLREVLNRVGVITYYTFSVKGFRENYALFAPNSRSLQERVEEKMAGRLSALQKQELMTLLEKPQQFKQRLNTLLDNNNLPFVATDRNVMNLPGVGKSMTFKTVGLTPKGERILAFQLDTGRNHSPVLNEENEVFIVENKSVAAYLRQLQAMGENPHDYSSVWTYNEGVTESRFGLFEYPEPREGQTAFFTHMPA